MRHMCQHFHLAILCQPRSYERMSKSWVAGSVFVPTCPSTSPGSRFVRCVDLRFSLVRSQPKPCSEANLPQYQVVAPAVLASAARVICIHSVLCTWVRAQGHRGRCRLRLSPASPSMGWSIDLIPHSGTAASTSNLDPPYCATD